MKIEPYHSDVVVDGLDDRPRPIVLRFETVVVIEVFYADEAIIPRGCSLVLPLDCDGNGLLKVPFDLIRRAYTPAETEVVLDCMDADQRLRGYAH